MENEKSDVFLLSFFFTGVRPYKCEDCGKCYRRSWGLKVHRYRHTGVKRFECDLCKSRFSVKTKLAKHIYGHIGEKPYKCDFCGRQYGERYQLKAHKCGNPSKTRIDRSFADSITQIVFFHPKSTNISFDSSTKSRWYSFCLTTYSYSRQNGILVFIQRIITQETCCRFYPTVRERELSRRISPIIKKKVNWLIADGSVRYFRHVERRNKMCVHVCVCVCLCI